MQTNLEWFRTFRAIYETGTLSGAAQELYISQPGVSLHLNSLEAYTGYKLFERSPRKMVPTEKGKILYNAVLEPIRKLETIEQRFMRRSQSERPTISVGMCFETFQYTLEEHIPKLPFNLVIKFGEYPQMQHDLETGNLDLIITPQKGNQKNIVYRPFSKERIVLIAGAEAETHDLRRMIDLGDIAGAGRFLKEQMWYSTAADMEHLKHFWLRNFNEHPDFRPNYILPNINSIVRCLSNGNGFTIAPNFLCLDALDSGRVQLVWEGAKPLENILYFGCRKNTQYQQELEMLEKIFTEKWDRVTPASA